MLLGAEEPEDTRRVAEELGLDAEDEWAGHVVARLIVAPEYRDNKPAPVNTAADTQGGTKGAD